MPASDAARTPDVPVTPPDVSADDELSADERALLVENLRYTLDGPALQVLATSREALRVDGELLHRLPPLPAPPLRPRRRNATCW